MSTSLRICCHIVKDIIKEVNEVNLKDIKEIKDKSSKLNDKKDSECLNTSLSNSDHKDINSNTSNNNIIKDNILSFFYNLIWY
jgi:hypothetical protein